MSRRKWGGGIEVSENGRTYNGRQANNTSGAITRANKSQCKVQKCRVYREFAVDMGANTTIDSRAAVLSSQSKYPAGSDDVGMIDGLSG